MQKNHVHLADINAVVQVHVNEIDHPAKARADFLAAFHWLKMHGDLAIVDAAMLRPE
jgi:hypothetical protein